jgi:two-component system, LytTR family, response regulator
MRVLIVDDEPIARQILRQELETVPDIEISGEADNGVAALAHILTSHPDLVFLDLEMPVMSGFEMINQLHGTPAPAFVIVTAYDQHAIRAFEAGAIDYLLKPVSQSRLAQSVDRARARLKSPFQIAEQLAQLQSLAPGSSDAPVRKVVGKLGEEFFLLNIHEVLAFQAEGDLTWILTAKQKYLATQNLRAIEGRLKNTTFRRIHRNALINVNHIRKLSMLSSQRRLVTMTNGQEFIVSKRLARNVRPFLQW